MVHRAPESFYVHSFAYVTIAEVEKYDQLTDPEKKICSRAQLKQLVEEDSATKGSNGSSTILLSVNKGTMKDPRKDGDISNVSNNDAPEKGKVDGVTGTGKEKVKDGDTGTGSNGDAHRKKMPPPPTQLMVVPNLINRRLLPYPHHVHQLESPRLLRVELPRWHLLAPLGSATAKEPAMKLPKEKISMIIQVDGHG